MTKPSISSYEFELFKKFSAHDAYPLAEQWLAKLSAIPEIQKIEFSGELRRGKSSIEHIDLVLAVDEPQAIHGQILRLNGFDKIIDQNEESIFLLLPSGIKLSIWLTQPANFANLLLHTTGSENHLEQLSRQAAKQGYRLERDGLWDAGNLVAVEDEADIYRKIGLTFIPPELRESGNEVDQARNLRLNCLIRARDIKSDLHIHTNWSDGKNSLEEMVDAAIQRGLSFIAITDHSPHLMKKYKDASYLIEQVQEIDRVQKSLQNSFNILKGVEVDIMPDGSLDLPDEILQKMDIVVASMHVELDQPMKEATARLIRAIENPYVNIIGHPGGRIFPMVDVTDLDWDRVYLAAAYNNVALEINSHKSHPIFNDQKVRDAAAAGALIALDSDSHNTQMLSNSRFGIAIARRAELQANQVINTWTFNHLKLWLQHKREAIARAL